MFERFSSPARRVLVLAQNEAQALGHDFIGTEHLLLGLAAETDSPVARVLARHGLTKGRIRSYVCLLVGAGTHGPRVDPRIDPAALATLGIDLDEVRRRVEATFGAGALASGRPRKRRDDCAGRRFAPRAKKTLQLALDEAGQQHVDPIAREHIALALLRTDGVAARLLAHHHVTRAVMQTALGDGPDQVAS
jgi:ATP-dependent Clp protease ATP-binding subunit ClpA